MANLLNVACQDPRALCIVACVSPTAMYHFLRLGSCRLHLHFVGPVDCDGLVTYSVNMLISCRLVDTLHIYKLLAGAEGTGSKMAPSTGCDMSHV